MTAAPAPAPEHRCPLCGGPNGCAPAQAGSFGTPCWCTAVEVRADALARLPAADRGRACLCRRCATEIPDEHETARGDVP